MDDEQKQEQMDIESLLKAALDGTLELEKFNGLVADLEKTERWRDAMNVLKIKNKLMEEELRKNEEELRKNADSINRTIKKVYRNGESKATWSCPTLKLNPTVEPSIKKKHQLASMGGQVASYAKTGTCNTEIWDKLDDEDFLTIPVETKAGIYLSSEFDPEVKLEYENEIEIQAYTMRMVQDALKCLTGKVNGKVKAKMEQAIFGLFADIVLVTESGKLVFVIEVKTPNRQGEKDNVCENERAGGQIWLYLMIMKANGTDNPLGAICTFNQIRIVSLEELNAKQFVAAQKQIANGFQYDTIPAGKNPTTSPGQTVYEITQKQKQYVYQSRYDKGKLSDHFPNAKVEEIEKGANVFVFKEAKLFGSKILPSHLVFPALVLSIATALMVNKAFQSEQTEASLPQVTRVDDLSGRLFAWGMPNQITMGIAKNFCVEKYDSDEVREKCDCKQFLMACDNLGQGSDVEVRLAVCLCKYAFAIKFYHYKRSQSKTAAERQQEDEDTIEQIKQKRMKELSIWRNLYPGRHVKTLTIDEKPCLLMEYGKPISVEDRKTRGAEVQQELLRFAHEGYKYKEMRWRHVLKDQNGKIFLADMGSLEKLKGSKSIIKLENKKYSFAETKKLNPQLQKRSTELADSLRSFFERAESTSGKRKWIDESWFEPLKPLRRSSREKMARKK